MRKQIDNDDYLRQMGYETRDVSLGTLVKWVIGLFVFVGVVSVIAVVFYAVLTPGEPEPRIETSPIPGARRPPPEPRVQGFPIPDMNKFRAEEDKKLNSYGWVDKNAGTVEIPVERAMELTAQRGLKFRPADTAAEDSAAGSANGFQQNAGTTPAAPTPQPVR